MKPTQLRADRENPIKVLFVCSGNTCRSPMAEKMWMQLCRESRIETSTSSAGVNAHEGESMNGNAADSLLKLGYEAGGHSAKLVSQNLIEWADLILAMDQKNKSNLLLISPDALEKLFTLGQFFELSELLIQDSQITQPGLANEEIETSQHMHNAQNLRENFGQDSRLDIPDPFGKGQIDYQGVAAQIEGYLKGIIAFLNRP